MTPEQFAYWLQGFAEMNGKQMPSIDQWEMIKSHLETVFKKVTPPLASPYLPNIQPQIQPQQTNPYTVKPTDPWSWPTQPNTIIC